MVSSLLFTELVIITNMTDVIYRGSIQSTIFRELHRPVNNFIDNSK